MCVWGGGLYEPRVVEDRLLIKPTCVPDTETDEEGRGLWSGEAGGEGEGGKVESPGGGR